MDNDKLDLQEKELQKLFDKISFSCIQTDELCKIIKYFFLATSTNN